MALRLAGFNTDKGVPVYPAADSLSELLAGPIKLDSNRNVSLQGTGSLSIGASGSVAGILSTNLLSKIAAATISGLYTFDRGAAAPFAVAAGSLKVDYLDADKLDGNEASAFATAAHVHSASDITSGTFGVERGGTGLSTLTAAGRLLYSTGASALATLAVGTAGQALKVNAGATAPEWGTLGVAGGGTGITDYTGAGRILYSSAGSALTALAPGTNGHVLTLAAGVPTWAASAAGSLAGLTDTNISGPASGQVIIWDGTDSWDNKSLSGDATMTATGAVTVASTIPRKAGTETINGNWTYTGNLNLSGVGTMTYKSTSIGESALLLGSAAGQIDSTTISRDTLFTPANYSPAGGYTGLTAELAGIDNALGGIFSGLTFKDTLWTGVGPAFDNAAGIRQTQAFLVPGMPVVGDKLYIDQDATNEVFTFVDGPPAAAFEVQLFPGTLNETLISLVTEINDHSTLVQADYDLVQDIDSSTYVVLLGAKGNASDYKTWACDDLGTGTWDGGNPSYSMNGMDPLAAFTAMGLTEPGSSNFSTRVAQATLVNGWCYSVRAGDLRGTGYVYNQTDDVWSRFRQPTPEGFTAGNGIEILTAPVPDTISVKAWNEGGLLVNGDGIQINYTVAHAFQEMISCYDKLVFGSVQPMTWHSQEGWGQYRQITEEGVAHDIYTWSATASKMELANNVALASSGYLGVIMEPPDGIGWNQIAFGGIVTVNLVAGEGLNVARNGQCYLAGGVNEGKGTATTPESGVIRVVGYFTGVVSGNQAEVALVQGYGTEII